MSAARWAAVLTAVVLGTAAAPPAAGAVDAPPLLCSALANNGPYVVDRTIEGDVLADGVDGGPCMIQGSVIHGDVVVPHDGQLHLLAVAVHGSVRAEGGVALTYGSTVDGDVLLDDDHAWRALEVWDSTVRGSVEARTGTARLVRSTVAGGYDVVTATRTQLVRSEVTGPVSTSGGRLLVHDTTLGAGLASTGSGEVLVCRTTVAGDLAVTGVQGYVRLGVEGGERCATTVGGSVVLTDNPHSLDLGDLAVTGDLVCTGNTGPRGLTTTVLTTVAGVRSGQCA